MAKRKRRKEPQGASVRVGEVLRFVPAHLFLWLSERGYTSGIWFLSWRTAHGPPGGPPGSTLKNARGSSGSSGKLIRS